MKHIKFVIFTDDAAHAICDCVTWEDFQMCVDMLEEQSNEGRKDFRFVYQNDVLTYRQMCAVCDALPSKNDLI